MSDKQYVNPGILPPAKTKQNEFGVKYMKNRFLTTLSFFDIQTERTFTYDLGREDEKSWQLKMAGINIEELNGLLMENSTQMGCNWWYQLFDDRTKVSGFL